MLSSVSPAASLLSRCVSAGLVSQEEIDSASVCPTPIFSSQLQEAEERMRTERQRDELQLQVELLRAELQSADVAHGFHLACRFQVIQMLGEHLQQLLREQSTLRHRLSRPLGHTHLPIPAHLHRSVVDSMTLMMDFIETLEEKLSSAHSGSAAANRLGVMIRAMDRLLAVAVALDSLFAQVLQWKSSDPAPSSHS